MLHDKPGLIVCAALGFTVAQDAGATMQFHESVFVYRGVWLLVFHGRCTYYYKDTDSEYWMMFDEVLLYTKDYGILVNTRWDEARLLPQCGYVTFVHSCFCVPHAGIIPDSRLLSSVNVTQAASGVEGNERQSGSLQRWNGDTWQYTTWTATEQNRTAMIRTASSTSQHWRKLQCSFTVFTRWVLQRVSIAYYAKRCT